MSRFTIGCDPEFFLYDTKEKMYVSAHAFLPGTKHKPYPLKNGAVQVDGTAVEFNIEPCCTKASFMRTMRSVLGQVREMVDPRYEFRFSPYVEFERDYFDSIPSSNKVLGCDPDFDAFRDAEVIKLNPEALPYSARTGGGHVHIGWGEGFSVEDRDHLWDCAYIAKGFSLTCTSIRNFRYNPVRERLYGKRGAFRPKSYGVECRELSNAWVEYPNMWEHVFEMTSNLMDSATQGIAPRIHYVCIGAKRKKWNG